MRSFFYYIKIFFREEIKQTQAAKLRCFLHYFERLKNDWPDVRGRVFYSRQVLACSPLLQPYEVFFEFCEF